MPLLSMPSVGTILRYLIKPIRKIVLQPLIAGCLLGGFYHDPQAETTIALVSNGRVSRSSATLILFTLVAVGFLYRLIIIVWRFRQTDEETTKDRSWYWELEVVTVNGGSSGIGALIANQLAEYGIQVVILDVKPPEQTALLQLKNVSFYQTNAVSSENIARVACLIRRESRPPTVLVNTAGTYFRGPLLAESEYAIGSTFDANTAALLLVREFVPRMVSLSHGHVVTVASMESFKAQASSIGYDCAKVATLAVHEGLKQELEHRWRSSKVRTTCV
jgi:NADP-dependent 3-hydroxy acid dehydrogenase YdfG